MNKHTFVDVIIPTYNRAHVIERSINSVLKQTYHNFVLHIIDDGSTDNTSLVLDQYKSHPQVKLYHQDNSGVSAARNAAALKGSGAWISFLDSDDEWLPNKLETQIKYADENPNYNFIHSEEVWIRNGVRVNPPKKFEKSNDNIFLRSLEFCLISPSTVMIKRSLFNDHRGFNEELIVCEDYDLWLRVLLREKIGFINTPLIYKYGGHADQLSTQFIAMDYWRIKSLVNILKHSHPNNLQTEQIKEMLKRKSDVLLKSYLKHQKQDSFDEITKAVASVMS